METNPQTSRNIEIVTKKEITIRKVLNIYGVFAALTLILSTFTTAISINENMQFFYNEDLIMGKKKINEYLLFIFGSSILYFSSVNLYYKYIK
ncbi:hypothetical protein IMZ08_18605 [Bacillus luteolus]|uniref:Uncharacterized protein n=1 Tax=Litchfieldia luteola TaxID=682179 RepID=A0ABR9QNH2_9BACI|nr:hypothetical protein [Cytobacillus luteolus]MBE4910053.1 hypothetical protein [Cytobacillus luteolus]MBP1942386.1 hypothetical protein [Cytobacillus luteolus]